MNRWYNSFKEDFTVCSFSTVSLAAECSLCCLAVCFASARSSSGSSGSVRRQSGPARKRRKSAGRYERVQTGWGAVWVWLMIWMTFEDRVEFSVVGLGGHASAY